MLYPSVIVGNRGFNIQTIPDIADNKLKLVTAGEFSIYKQFEMSVIDNDTDVKVINKNAHLVFTDTPGPYHAETYLV